MRWCAKNVWQTSAFVFGANDQQHGANYSKAWTIYKPEYFTFSHFCFPAISIPIWKHCARKALLSQIKWDRDRDRERVALATVVKMSQQISRLKGKLNDSIFAYFVYALRIWPHRADVHKLCHRCAFRCTWLVILHSSLHCYRYWK